MNPGNDDAVVVIHSLTKHYGETCALDGTSWSIPKGALLGFLGPNGAGKTTTIRILTGFLKSDGGRATVFALDAWAQSTAIRRRVGYLPGDVRLYNHLTGDQMVRFAGRARGMTDADNARRLAQRLQLDLHTRIRGYSKGMRQKLGLILAMMHEPELLILDEPTAALDPLMQQVLYRELRDVTARGKTVLLSSHSLSEVEAICDSVIILRNGSVVASTPVREMRKDAAQKVHLRFHSSAELAQIRSSAPPALTVTDCENGSLKGHWQGPPESLLAWLASLPVSEIAIHPPDLEDLFMGYYSAETAKQGDPS